MPDEKLLKAVTTYLRAEAPEVVEKATDEEIFELARAGVEQAKNHGVDDGYYVSQFVLFMAWCGPKFDQETWAKEILDNPELSQETKIVQLEDRILSTKEGQ